ncbi:MAG: helix-turn-helix domain-containing protein [Pseudomonadota bacterium]
MISEKKQNPLVQRLVDLCRDYGWSYTALSTKAGLGKGAVGDIIANPDRRPRDQTIMKLAKALGVEPLYLLGETDQDTSHLGLKEGIAPLEDKAADEVFVAIQNVIGREGNSLKAWSTAFAPASAGVPKGSTILVDMGASTRSGDLVLASTADSGVAVRYLAEPYLVATGPAGQMAHATIGPDAEILGKIVLVISPPLSRFT